MNPKKMISRNRESPLVSILIVAFNPWKYLIQTLRSCLDQTYQNTEILILDNASEEDIQVYFPTNSKIHIIRSDVNLGPYKGLNFLLEKAHGTYIAIQDHDDIWHPHKLEKQIDFLEHHRKYRGCGTNTIMYYEADKKYFEYFIWETNYYTIHPSLVFRNTWNFHYDTDGTEYMCDAWSLKNNLCHGEKKIYNLPEPLTLHLIKAWSGNYSYRWHQLSWKNIRRVYQLHAFGYATLTIGWEILRKIFYPGLNVVGKWDWINAIERFPFRMLGNTIKKSQKNDWWMKYLGI